MISDDSKLLQISEIEERMGVIGKAFATCETHGRYVAVSSSRFETASGCPACAQIRRETAEREQAAAQRASDAAERLARKLGAAMIPRRFAGKSFDDYRASNPRQARILETCRDYAAQFPANAKAGRCLLLLGKPGTGKTHLAAAIAEHVISQHGLAAVYRTVSSILQFIKGSYDHASDYSEAEAYAALAEPDLLIIDEIGATKPTEFELAVIFQIINSRYEDMLPTIVVSNLEPDELKAAIGDRCIDRLREGGGKALVFGWESMRPEIGRAEK